MKNIYGAIGYTLLTNNLHNVIILSDMHDTLPTCANNIIITKWLKSKITKSKILLEEIERSDTHRFVELWSDSPHTQELMLVPFSLELLDMNIAEHNISCSKFYEEIDTFFSLSNVNIKLPIYNIDKIKHTKIGKHFLKLKENYYIFLTKYGNNLKITIYNLLQQNRQLINDFNDLLDKIMEWYICANVVTNIEQPIILHTGLAHSEQVVLLLNSFYNYDIIHKQGINELNDKEVPLKGCIHLSPEIDEQFGTST